MAETGHTQRPLAVRTLGSLATAFDPATDEVIADYYGPDAEANARIGAAAPTQHESLRAIKAAAEEFLDGGPAHTLNRLEAAEALLRRIAEQARRAIARATSPEGE